MKLALQAPPKLILAVKPFSDIDVYDAQAVLEDEGGTIARDESKNPALITGDIQFQLDLLREYPNAKITLVASDLDSFVKLRATVPPSQVMGTLQADDIESLFELVEKYYFDSPVSIPFNVCSVANGKPFTMALLRAHIACNIPTNLYVHLWEFNHLSEFFWYEGRTNIASLSTFMPVFLGLQRVSIVEPLAQVPIDMEAESENLMKDRISEEALTSIYANIAILRKHLR